jgi:nitrite reductase/ring-hydroxylating ferredoxin subunit
MPWIKALRAADFPPPLGSKTVSLLGRKIGLFRNEDGGFSVMEVACRHQNADLTQGKRDGSLVVCPRHGWRYDLATGECLTESWAGLRTFETQIEGDWLKVRIGEE